MLSYLLELLTLAIVAAVKSPGAERTIVEILNPIYVWLLSQGL